MFLKAFALLDMKTGLYSQPFFFVHKGLAVRAAMEMGFDQSTTVGRYPYDFRLVHIGEYDDSIGLLSHGPHEDLGTIGSILAANDMRRENQNPAPDLAEMTASEVVQFHEASKSA